MKARPVTCAFLIASLSTITALNAQSLGDVAKKAQEQRDKAKAAAAEKAKTDAEQGKVATPTGKPSAVSPKVYTNKDLPDGPSTAPPVAGEKKTEPDEKKTEPAVNDTAKAAAAQSDEPVKD